MWNRLNEMEKMIVVIGDSHVDSYVDDLDPLFTKRWFGASTAYGLINDKSWSKMEKACEELDPKTDTLVFCFGEIDCRIHIFYQSKKQGRSCESLIDRTVRRYLRAIKMVRGRGFAVWVIGIMPSVRQGNFYGYPYYGNEKTRAYISKDMNERLKKECESNGIKYFDLYGLNLDDGDGLIRMDVVTDSVHINPDRFPIREKFKEWACQA